MKGKVERGVGYVKGSFLEGRSLVDVIDLQPATRGLARHRG